MTSSYGTALRLTLFGESHGPAVGYFLAGYVEVCEKKVPEDVQKILALLGLQNTADFTAMLDKFIGKCKVPSEIRDQFAAAMKVNHSKLDLVPGGITPEEVDFIYDKSLVVE